MPRPKKPAREKSKQQRNNRSKKYSPENTQCLEETIEILDSDDDFATPNPSIRARLYRRFHANIITQSSRPSPQQDSNLEVGSNTERDFEQVCSTNPSPRGINSNNTVLINTDAGLQRPHAKRTLELEEVNQDTVEFQIDSSVQYNCKLEGDILCHSTNIVSTTIVKNDDDLTKSSTECWSALMHRMQHNQKTNIRVAVLSKKPSKSLKHKNKSSIKQPSSAYFVSKAPDFLPNCKIEGESSFKKPKLDFIDKDDEMNSTEELIILQSESAISMNNHTSTSPVKTKNLISPDTNRSTSTKHVNTKIPDMFLKPTERAAILQSKRAERSFIHNDLCDALKELSTEPESYGSVTDATGIDGNIVKLNEFETENPFGNKTKVCPFYKKIPGTRFSIDAFNYGLIPGVEVYFLSHFHSDHYMGLSKKFCKTLVCSPPTATLARMKFSVDERCIRRLQINTPYIVDGVEVTLVNANHCPGSVMFIFRLKNGTTYFHTGDFRFTVSMLDNHILRDLRVDCLYLDTTYCDPQYNFPTQTEAITELITVIKGKLELQPKTLIICGSYVIGKERVYFSLAEAVGAKVFMNSEKRRIIHALENPRYLSYLTDREESGSIHVHQMFSINPKFLSDYLHSRKNRYTHIIGVKPTGWQFSSSGESSAIKSFYNNTVTMIGIPYSEHSSYSELEQFVKAIRPSKVQPTVNVGNVSKREHMMHHINKWLINE